MGNTSSLGQSLRELRTRIGLSQAEVAERLKINPKTLQRWEHNQSLPSEKRLKQLAQLYSAFTLPYDSELGISSRDVENRTLELLPYESASMAVLDSSVVRILIDEEPLTAQNLNIAISALTELSTKYWLIAKGRYADLIEYTQTHNSRFAEEANAIITRVSYNSPFNIDWRLSASDVANAIVTALDGFKQQKERLEKTQLENQAKAQQIKEAEQKSELEREKQQVEIEKQRLELLSMQLDMQKKSFDIALELAGKAVDTLQPGLDPSTRAMAIQAVIPNVLQLDGVKGLSAISSAIPQLPAPNEKQSAK